MIWCAMHTFVTRTHTLDDIHILHWFLIKFKSIIFQWNRNQTKPKNSIWYIRCTIFKFIKLKPINRYGYNYTASDIIFAIISNNCFAIIQTNTDTPQAQSNGIGWYVLKSPISTHYYSFEINDISNTNRHHHRINEHWTFCHVSVWSLDQDDDDNYEYRCGDNCEMNLSLHFAYR